MPSRLRGVLTLGTLVGSAAVLPLAAAPFVTAVGAEPRDNASVRIVDSAYLPAAVEIFVDGRVVWTATNNAQLHSVTFEDKTIFPNGDHRADIPPGSDVRLISPPFPRAGRFAYFCEYHGAEGMTGTVTVSEKPPPPPPPTTTTTASPPTTTTTAPPPTTTTTAPPPTTTTTAPPATTTTTRPAPATTTTAPPATTTTTRPAPTTTSTRPPTVAGAVTNAPSPASETTTTTATAKKPKDTTTTTTTAPPAAPSAPAPLPETTTTSLEPATTTTAGATMEIELAGPTDDNDSGAGGKIPLGPLAGGLGLLVLGGGAWAFYHRPSRYLPA